MKRRAIHLEVIVVTSVTGVYDTQDGTVALGKRKFIQQGDIVNLTSCAR
jgi:hypothetical protein